MGGPWTRRQAKKPQISQTMLSIIEQCRKAILVCDVKEYKRFTCPQWWALGHDKQQWAEKITLEGQQHHSVVKSETSSPNSVS